MVERSIKELLILLLNNIDKDIETEGLCRISKLLYYRDEISLEEFRRLNFYIHKNKPFWARFYSFYSGYYWPEGEKKYRIKFLKFLIAREDDNI